MGSRVRCRPVTAGVRATLKDPAVQAMLHQAAVSAASRCNALCDPNLRRRGAVYEPIDQVRGYTAVSLVVASGAQDGALARVDNWRNNTLKKGCDV